MICILGYTLTPFVLARQLSEVDFEIMRITRQYNLKILDDNELNAYSTADRIYVTKRMMELMKDNKEGYLMVLLHEEGHILRKSLILRVIEEHMMHFNVRMCEGDYACISEARANYLKQQRYDEYMCDQYAINKAREMKLDAEKFCYFWKVLSARTAYNTMDKYQTHPAPVKRYRYCINDMSPTHN